MDPKFKARLQSMADSRRRSLADLIRIILEDEVEKHLTNEHLKATEDPPSKPYGTPPPELKERRGKAG